MSSWAPAIETVTLFVEDLAAAKDFYRRVLVAEPMFEDAESCVFRLGANLVNLLDQIAAGELVEPRQPCKSRAPRMVLTVLVDDVDAQCERLAAAGVPLLNGPVDRPWGRRTAAFEDPSGHVWELAQEIPPPA